MAKDLDYLIEKSKSVKMSPKELEEQRHSFAYGNTNIENPLITRETVSAESRALKSGDE